MTEAIRVCLQYLGIRKGKRVSQGRVDVVRSDGTLQVGDALLRTSGNVRGVRAGDQVPVLWSRGPGKTIVPTAVLKHQTLRGGAAPPPLIAGQQIAAAGIEELIADLEVDPFVPDHPLTGRWRVWFRDARQFTELAAAREEWPASTVLELGWGQADNTFFVRAGGVWNVYQLNRPAGAATPTPASATLLKTVTPPDITLPWSTTWASAFTAGTGALTNHATQIRFPSGLPLDLDAPPTGYLALGQTTLTAALDLVWTATLSTYGNVVSGFPFQTWSEEGLGTSTRYGLGMTQQDHVFAVWSRTGAVVWSYTEGGYGGAGYMHTSLVGPFSTALLPAPAYGWTASAKPLTWDDADPIKRTWAVQSAALSSTAGSVGGTYLDNHGHPTGGPAGTMTQTPVIGKLVIIDGTGAVTPIDTGSEPGFVTLLAIQQAGDTSSFATGEVFTAGLISPTPTPQTGAFLRLGLVRGAGDVLAYVGGSTTLPAASSSTERLRLVQGGIVRDAGSFTVSSPPILPPEFGLTYLRAFRAVGPGVLYAVTEHPPRPGGWPVTVDWPPALNAFLAAATAALYPADAPTLPSALGVKPAALSDALPGALGAILGAAPGIASYAAAVSATRLPSLTCYHVVGPGPGNTVPESAS